MSDIVKLLVGLADANSKSDRIIVIVKEAVLVIIAAQAVLATAQSVLQDVLKAFGAN